MFKNTAAKFIVFAFDATTNVPKTGDAANITVYVSKDYGAVTALTDTSATEMDATNAPGYYLVDAAQSETNADCLLVSGKSSTSNVKVIGAPAVIYTRPQTGWLAPTTAGRTLDVSAGGEAGIDWANIGSPTTAVDLSGTNIKTDQKVDLNTIKTQTVTCAGGVTVPAATLASTTNITAGTITTATNVTTVNGLANNVITAASINADAITAAKLASDVTDEIWAKACTEPTSVVAASPTAIAALSWLLTLSRNKITQTSTEQILKADDGTTTIATSTVSDDGTTATRGEFA